tara:strand:+ start:3114 stop:3941 length:828 start_codon:yes stop_codon:yes gene_type:complete
MPYNNKEDQKKASKLHYENNKESYLARNKKNKLLMKKKLETDAKKNYNKILKSLEINLNKYNNLIDIQQKKLQEIEDKKKKWLDKNRPKIKSIYPKKGKTYEIINIKKTKVYQEQYSYWRYRDIEVNDNDKLYFKITNTRFEMALLDKDNCPKVKGDVLDINLKKIDEDENLCINNLRDIIDTNSPSLFRDRPTNVYVMIDKNTGYYKIGRSIHPKFRERTLQSEKPTIEMLFHHNAMIKDEKELHELFKNKRVRGEWFDLNGTDLNKIKEYFHN